ncbi:Cathepsin L-like proteinase [Fragariocoptes setiger]|uniref:Cathepsin L-like proteinase n=1 Tax=Fragariocoptes setiger TaxID=1670756 RepID=A0ABQ7SBF9_9ACAR|nr:Cathepsin L-like proteinase [Fragariocoptes setiger]
MAGRLVVFVACLGVLIVVQLLSVASASATGENGPKNGNQGVQKARAGSSCRRYSISVSSSLKVFLHNTLYVKCKTTYYLAITEFSDRTSHELRFFFRRPKSKISGNKNKESGETVMIEEEQLEKRLEALISSNTPESRQMHLKKQSPKEIDNIPEGHKNPYHLPPVVMSRGESSFALSDPEELFTTPMSDADSVLSDGMSRLSASLQQSTDPYSLAKHHEEVDESLIDWRDEGCFMPVKHQYNCDSCWAFPAIAKIEFEYCRQSQHLVRFSEQYLISCSLNLDELFFLAGCEGGDLGNIHDFINNYGLELERNISYVAENGTCPCAKSTPPGELGVVRPIITDRGPMDQSMESPGTLDYRHLQSPIASMR